MTIAFKYMMRVHAERFSQGEIRIGSFTYYRREEHRAAIRDVDEGITVGRTGPVILTSESPDPHETLIAGLKFATASGGMIDASNMTFVRSLPPLYIHSTSLVGTVGHFKGYDTVVKINDVEQLGRILVDGRRDLFDGYWANRVRYEPRAYDAFGHPGLDPDPFVKEVIFSRDEEYRIVFKPAGDRSVEDHVTFSLNSIQKAFMDGLCEILG